MNTRAKTVSLWAQTASHWECVARKPGNVHRMRDFDDTTLLDFITSASAIGPVLAMAEGQPLGQTILEAVKATHKTVGRNTNLGLILAMAPLAKVPEGIDLKALTEVEAVKIYQEGLKNKARNFTPGGGGRGRGGGGRGGWRGRGGRGRGGAAT